MELLLILLLGLLLIVSTATGISVLFGLVFWLVLIFIYGLRHGCTWKQLVIESGKQILSVRVVLITFVLIGMLSAVLRQCGTIQLVVSLCSHIESGKILLPAVFLVCSLMSMCTGSSFASAASAGIICATVGAMSGIPYDMVCGAVLSGIYVGDRMSPVSSSVALVAELSHNDIYLNIRSMLRRFAVPFLAATAFYAVFSVIFGSSEIQRYESDITVSWMSIIPVVLILVLSLLRVKSRITLTAAIVSGFLVGWLANGVNPGALLLSLITGCHSADSSGALLNGGGIVSMLNPAVIIMVASCYVGVFDLTGFLNPMKDKLKRLPMPESVRNLLLSIVSSCLSGSQTLAVVLTSLMMEDDMGPQKKADTLEDMPILIPAMVPWSIAWSVPAAIMDAGAGSILFSFYLYFVPLRFLLLERRKKGIVNAKKS